MDPSRYETTTIMSESFVKVMRWAARLFQRIARQLGIPRTRRGQLALVEIELVRGHCTELWWLKGFEFGPYLLQGGCGTFSCNWTRTPAACTRQGQMGLEGTSIPLESQRLKGLTNRVCELR